MDRARTCADNFPVAIRDESVPLPRREENGAQQSSAHCSPLKSRGPLYLPRASQLQAYSHQCLRPPSQPERRIECVHVDFLSRLNFPDAFYARRSLINRRSPEFASVLLPRLSAKLWLRFHPGSSRSPCCRPREWEASSFDGICQCTARSFRLSTRS